MLQLQLGKRPTMVSQPKIRAGFLPPQICLGFSWSVGYSESHCNIVYFLNCCVKPLPHRFPFRVPVFLFSGQGKVPKFQVQILSDLDSKGGACLGPMSGPFYPVPIFIQFYQRSFLSTFNTLYFVSFILVNSLPFNFIYLNLERLSDPCK